MHKLSLGAVSMYKILDVSRPNQSLGSNMFELRRTVHEIVSISLRYYPPLVWFLHKILISLLLSEMNSVFFRFEVDMGSLKKVCRGLPAH